MSLERLATCFSSSMIEIVVSTEEKCLGDYSHQRQTKKVRIESRKMNYACRCAHVEIDQKRNTSKNEKVVLLKALASGTGR